MSETKIVTIAISVTVDFDKLPNNVGKNIKGKRWYQPDRDTEQILSYADKRIGEGADILTLEGYLPPWAWLEVGAYLRVNFVNIVDRIEYRAQNGFSCELPNVAGYVDV
jgi:hypothetical protein